MDRGVRVLDLLHLVLQIADRLVLRLSPRLRSHLSQRRAALRELAALLVVAHQRGDELAGREEGRRHPRVDGLVRRGEQHLRRELVVERLGLLHGDLLQNEDRRGDVLALDVVRQHAVVVLDQPREEQQLLHAAVRRQQRVRRVHVQVPAALRQKPPELHQQALLRLLLRLRRDLRSTPSPAPTLIPLISSR